MKLSIQMDDITPEQGIRVMRAALSVEVEKLQAAGKIPSHKPTDGLPAGAQPAGTPPVKKEAKNVPVKKTKPAKKKKGHRGRENKYLIPFPQGPEYCKAYRLCLKHRCTYPEALALENKSVENIQKSTEKAPPKIPTPASKSHRVVRKQKALPLHQHSKTAALYEGPTSAEPQGWSEAEDAAIRDCPSEEAMLMRYMEKFPDSNRRALEVIEHWKAIHVDADVAEASS